VRGSECRVRPRSKAQFAMEEIRDFQRKVKAFYIAEKPLKSSIMSNKSYVRCDTSSGLNLKMRTGI